MASKCNFCTIRKTTIFADLKEVDLNRIEKLITEKRFPKKHIIFWEDDPVKNIYLIKRANFTKPNLMVAVRSSIFTEPAASWDLTHSLAINTLRREKLLQKVFFVRLKQVISGNF
ncbi:MAG: hypothetical protein JRI87_11325 [Deltaproteobacteria bacterium]|nr:hypothetical protein [Deltaproteobacteria bacterium]